MFEIKNKDQTVTVSEVGGTVIRWQYRGVDIFYPQQLVKRERKMKHRGGMHACFPNFGTVDSKFGLPQHGPLRNRKADIITEAPTGGSAVFKGTDLLGPTYDEECEVRIAIALTQTGFMYALAARLSQPATRDVFVNPGFHPYFRTPTKNARAGAWEGKMHRFYQRKYGPQSSDVGQGAEVIVQGVGTIQMLLGGVWNSAKTKKVVFWRDSYRYLCVEPVLGNSRTYGGPDCQRLTDKWLNLSCAFRVSLG